MEIYPRDLGTRRHLTLLRRRASVGSGKNSTGAANAAGVNAAALSAEDVKPSRSRFVKAWTRNMKTKDPEVRARAATLALGGSAGVGLTLGLIFGTMYLAFPLVALATTLAGPVLGFLVFCAWLASIPALVVNVPRRSLEKMDNTPLTAAEVESLMMTSRGRLDRAYLNLVLDAVREAGAANEGAKEDIRGAITALGETIDRLPAEPVRAQDPEALHRAAEARRLEAGREMDAATKASLVRQAEALERRALLGESGTAAARRAKALRQEVMVQMDALRAVLLSFDQHHAGPTARATAQGLSETVHRVTAEAEAAAQAHRELQEDEIAILLGRALPAPQAGAVSPVRAPAAPPVQQQTVAGNGAGATAAGASAPAGTAPRKWWRNP